MLHPIHPLAELLEYMMEGDDPIVQLFDMAPNKKQEVLDILPCQLHPIARGHLAQQQKAAVPQPQPGMSQQQQQDAMRDLAGKGHSAAANNPAAPVRQPGGSTPFGAAGASMHTPCSAAMPPSVCGAAGKPAVAGQLTGQGSRADGPQPQGSAVKKPPALRPPSASKGSGMRLNTHASSKVIKPDARASPTKTGCSMLDSGSCLGSGAEAAAEGQQVSDSSAPEASCLVGGVTGSSFTALPRQLDAGGLRALADANARRAEGRGSNDGAADSANTCMVDAEGVAVADVAAAAAEPDTAADGVEAMAPFISTQMSSTEAGARFAVALAELERLQLENERLQQQQAEFLREQGHREVAVQLREHAVQEREQALQLREQRLQQQEQAMEQKEMEHDVAVRWLARLQDGLLEGQHMFGFMSLVMGGSDTGADPAHATQQGQVV